jgi:hypothetical protein
LLQQGLLYTAGSSHEALTRFKLRFHALFLLGSSREVGGDILRRTVQVLTVCFVTLFNGGNSSLLFLVQDLVANSCFVLILLLFPGFVLICFVVEELKTTETLAFAVRKESRVEQ